MSEPLFPVLSSNKEKEEVQEQGLFPVFIPKKKKNEDERTVSLFPITSNTNDKKKPVDNLSWLVNTSFQTSIEQENEENEEEEVPSSESDEEGEENKKKRKKLKKDKKKKKRKTDKEKIIELEMKAAKEDSRKPTDIWINEEKALKVYFIDRNGDQNNILFGSIYRLDVPIYRKGRRYCLGLSSDEGITVTKSGKYEIYKHQGRDSSQIVRYTDRNYSYQENDVEFKRIYMPLQKEQHKKETPAWVQSDFIPVEEKEGKEESNEEEVFEFSMEFSHNKEGESLDDYLTRQTREFNANTRYHPEDIKLWLKFVDFQDEYMKLGKKQTKGIIIEKKISILERALEDNPRSEELKLAFLREASQLWQSEKVNTLWDKTLGEHRYSYVIWKDYINFKQRNFNEFAISSMREIYGNALQSMQSIVIDNTIGEEASKIRALESDLLDLFLRFCIFEKQSGHIEKAVGYFQALLEFNFFPPSDIFEYKAQLKSFEKFWNSDSPRIGDEVIYRYLSNQFKGAIGWCHWVKKPQKETISRFSSLKKENKKKVLDENEVAGPQRPRTADEDEKEKKLYESWVSEEESREHEWWQPCRPLAGFGLEEGGDVEDPERVVLFDDIQNLLFQFTCDDLKFELVYRFMEFLGAQLPSRCSSNDRYFIQRLLFYENVEDLIELFTFNAKDTQWEKFKPISDLSVIQFIRSVFLQLLKIHNSNTELALNYIRFESSYELSNARKWTKNYLKDNRNNLNLYDGFAQMEKRNGKLDEARKVYGPALSLYNMLPPSFQISAPLLFRNFAELELENNNTNAAIHILASFAENGYSVQVPTKVEPTRIIKARKVYQQKCEELKNASIHTMHFLICYATFEYLTAGLETSSEIFKKSLQFFKEGEKLHEDITIAYAKLVYRHSTQYPTPPGKLRDILLKALDIYPNNYLFINLFIDNETRSQMANRIRTFFSDSLTKRPSVVTWILAIHTETAKLGAMPRVRTLFERALEHPEGRSMIQLWRYYIQFELRKGTPSSAKGIFYRAIRESPWSKAIWLDALRVLLPYLTLSELNELLKMINEKEIRIRKFPEIE